MSFDLAKPVIQIISLLVRMHSPFKRVPFGILSTSLFEADVYERKEKEEKEIKGSWK